MWFYFNNKILPPEEESGKWLFKEIINATIIMVLFIMIICGGVYWEYSQYQARHTLPQGVERIVQKPSPHYCKIHHERHICRP